MATVMGTMASVSLLLEHDPDAAFRWWERALEAQPQLVEVRAQYALQGLICLRHDDARGMAELARAVSDDPRNAVCAAQNSVGLIFTGRVAEAVAEAQRAYELDSHSFLTLYARVTVLAWAGEAEGVLAAANTAFAVLGRNSHVLGPLVLAYLKRGERSLAEAVYTELQVRSQTDQQVSRMTLANAASALGSLDEAITYAIESVERCDNFGPFWTRQPFFSEAAHAHPRYPELLRAIGL
jgi:tetratricopeptide (TPR) repeat protein